MTTHPIIRLIAAGAALWAAPWLLWAARRGANARAKHAAINPADPAADRSSSPFAVRSAGPQAMRDGNYHEWDKVDQAADESFPASDPPSR